MTATRPCTTTTTWLRPSGTDLAVKLACECQARLSATIVAVPPGRAGWLSRTRPSALRRAMHASVSSTAAAAITIATIPSPSTRAAARTTAARPSFTCTSFRARLPAITSTAARTIQRHRLRHRRFRHRHRVHRQCLHACRFLLWLHRCHQRLHRRLVLRHGPHSLLQLHRVPAHHHQRCHRLGRRCRRQRRLRPRRHRRRSPLRSLR